MSAPGGKDHPFDPRKLAGLKSTTERQSNGGLLRRFGNQQETEPTYTQLRLTPEPRHSQILYNLFARIENTEGKRGIPNQYVTDQGKPTMQISIPVTELFQLIRNARALDNDQFVALVERVRDVIGNTVTQLSLQESYQTYLSLNVHEDKLAAREEWKKDAERHINNIFFALELERLGQLDGLDLAITPEQKARCGMDNVKDLRAAAELLNILFVYDSLQEATALHQTFDMLPDESIMDAVTQRTGPKGMRAMTSQQAEAIFERVRAGLREALSDEAFRGVYGNDEALQQQGDTSALETPTLPRKAILQPLPDETDGKGYIADQPTIVHGETLRTPTSPEDTTPRRTPKRDDSGE